MTGATGTIAAGTTSVSATDAISVHGIEYLSASVDTKGSIGAVGIEYDAAAVDPYGGYSDSVTWRSDGSLMKVDHELGPHISNRSTTLTDFLFHHRPPQFDLRRIREPPPIA